MASIRPENIDDDQLESRPTSWFKLRCRDWLNGPVRFELTPADRSLLVDIMALARQSKYCPVIASGIDRQGEYCGYPYKYLSSIVCFSTRKFRASLNLLEEKGLIETCQNGNGIIIKVSNFDKIQDDYLRQRPYRQGKKGEPATPDDFRERYGHFVPEAGRE